MRAERSKTGALKAGWLAVTVSVLCLLIVGCYGWFSLGGNGNLWTQDYGASKVEKGKTLPLKAEGEYVFATCVALTGQNLRAIHLPFYAEGAPDGGAPVRVALKNVDTGGYLASWEIPVTRIVEEGNRTLPLPEGVSASWKRLLIEVKLPAEQPYGRVTLYQGIDEERRFAFALSFAAFGYSEVWQRALLSILLLALALTALGMILTAGSARYERMGLLLLLAAMAVWLCRGYFSGRVWVAILQTGGNPEPLRQYDLLRSALTSGGKSIFRPSDYLLYDPLRLAGPLNALPLIAPKEMFFATWGVVLTLRCVISGLIVFAHAKNAGATKVLSVALSAGFAFSGYLWAYGTGGAITSVTVPAALTFYLLDRYLRRQKGLTLALLAAFWLFLNCGVRASVVYLAILFGYWLWVVPGNVRVRGKSIRSQILLLLFPAALVFAYLTLHAVARGSTGPSLSMPSAAMGEGSLVDKLICAMAGLFTNSAFTQSTRYAYAPALYSGLTTLLLFASGFNGERKRDAAYLLLLLFGWLVLVLLVAARQVSMDPLIGLQVWLIAMECEALGRRPTLNRYIPTVPVGACVALMLFLGQAMSGRISWRAMLLSAGVCLFLGVLLELNKERPGKIAAAALIAAVCVEVLLLAGPLNENGLLAGPRTPAPQPLSSSYSIDR